MPVPLNLQCLLGIAYQLAAWLRRLVLIGHVIPPAATKFRVFRITNPTTSDLRVVGKCLPFSASLVVEFEHERSVSNHATACLGSRNSILWLRQCHPSRPSGSRSILTAR